MNLGKHRNQPGGHSPKTGPPNCRTPTLEPRSFSFSFLWWEMDAPAADDPRVRPTVETRRSVEIEVVTRWVRICFSCGLCPPAVWAEFPCSSRIPLFFPVSWVSAEFQKLLFTFMSLGQTFVVQHGLKCFSPFVFVVGVRG